MTTLLGAALRIKQMLTPGTPPAGTSSLYPKADGKWYTKDPTGAEALVGPDTQILLPVRNSTGDLQGNITTSGLQTLDGVLGVAGDRVLLRSQTAVAENGIWIVAAGAWTRATDADTAAEVPRGTRVRVLEGNDHKYKVFTQFEVAPFGANGQVWRVHTAVDQVNVFNYPTPQGVGHQLYDANRKQLVVYDGSSWVPANYTQICTSTTRPVYPTDGMQIYETDTAKTYVYQGSSWKAVGGGGGGTTEVSISTAGPAPRVGELLWVDTDEPGGLDPTRMAWGQIAYAQITSEVTGLVNADIPGLTVTVYAPGGRRYKITGYAAFDNTAANMVAFLQIKEGTLGLGGAQVHLPIVNTRSSVNAVVVLTPSAGLHTYKLTVLQSGGSTAVRNSTGEPSFILVEDIGAA